MYNNNNNNNNNRREDGKRLDSVGGHVINLYSLLCALQLKSPLGFI